MAERRARAPAVPPLPGASPAASDDGLAELNDHLGRFLRQADELLDEWARFGAGVRVKLDEQLRDVEAAFAAGADKAAARASAALGKSLDDAAAARVDRVLGERVAALRVELERLERIARGLANGAQANGAPRSPDAAALARRTWLAAIAANALLVVLIILVWWRDHAPAAPAPPASVIDHPALAAPPVADAAAPPDAVVDAGVPDASLPPDAAPAGRGARHAVAPHAAAPHP